MDDIEKDLERLEFAQPPPWAKARALVAAENVLRRQARRTRYKCVAAAAVAASVSIIVVGTYIADAIAPILKRSGPSFSYPPRESHDRMGGQLPDILPPRRPAPRGPEKQPPKEPEKKEKEEDKDDRKETEDAADREPGQDEG